MTSDRGVSKDALDERLAEARDSVFLEEEKVIAQEEGDTGQAIVLTDSRLLIVKVGITATGIANGRKVSEYSLTDISALNVRKGPLGAVIQVCTQDKQTTPPDNVIVFTGVQRIKKCEAFAAGIESALGKRVSVTQPTVEKTSPPAPQVDTSTPEAKPDNSEITAADDASTEPAGKPSRGGRQAVSLAEELFAELVGPQQSVEAVPEPESPDIADPITEFISPVEPEPDTLEESEEESEGGQSPQLGPNPYLPKPAQAGKRGTNRVLALVGGLGALVLLGVGVTAPLRAPVKAPTVQIGVTALTRNVDDIRKQYIAVSAFGAKVNDLLTQCRPEIAAFQGALRTGNQGAIESSIRAGITDRTWRDASALDAPSGLAAAKESLVAGLFDYKNALADATSNSQGAQRQLSEGRALIEQCVSSTAKMMSDLNAQMSEIKSLKKRN